MLREHGEAANLEYSKAYRQVWIIFQYYFFLPIVAPLLCILKYRYPFPHKEENQAKTLVEVGTKELARAMRKLHPHIPQNELQRDFRVVTSKLWVEPLSDFSIKEGVPTEVSELEKLFCVMSASFSWELLQ